MATYAIGDIQGCYESLARLLEVVAFDPAQDRLWLAGDLVNRGPQSAATLRLVRSLGARAVTVLGNHDLHTLAIAAGGRRSRRDTLEDLFAAPDCDELLDWLRRQKLLHRESGTAMVHAGLVPQWTLDTAAQCAAEVEQVLAGPDYAQFLAAMYGDEPTLWDDALSGLPRLRFTVNCLTRLRYCTPDGRVDLKPKGEPGSQPAGLVPWFAVPAPRWGGARLITGHWSTLGRVHWPEFGVYALDTGCVWGGRLTALQLEGGTLSSVDCPSSSGIDDAGD